MKLQEAMNQLKATAVDELYESLTGTYIVRYTGEHDGFGALFMVLRLVDDSWLTGSIWLPFGSEYFLVEDVVNQCVQRNLQWLMLKLAEDHGQEWDDWDIYSAESFAELCHRCDPHPIRIYQPAEPETVDVTM